MGTTTFFFTSHRLVKLQHCCLHYYNGWEDKKDKKDKLSSFFTSHRLVILQHCCLHYYNGREDKKDKKDKVSSFLRAGGS